MKNITLSVDESVLDQARIYAARRKTTVSRLVREHLEELARAEQKADTARERLLKLIDKSSGRMGPDWKWSREDAYEGRVLPGHKRPAVRRAGKGR
jgi:hypothetical protein